MYKQYFIWISLLITIIFFSCSKDSQEEEAANISLFNEFIGEWILESQTVDGVVDPTIGFYMLNIQEDSNSQDSILTGFYQHITPGENKDLTVEFTENENEIILRNWAIFTCTYSFLEDGRLQLTDIFESDSTIVVDTWVKQ